MMGRWRESARIFKIWSAMAHVKGAGRYRPERVVVAEVWRRAREPSGIPPIGQVTSGAGKRPRQDRPGLAGPLDRCRYGSFFHDGRPRTLPNWGLFRVYRLPCFLGFDLRVVAGSI